MDLCRDELTFSETQELIDRILTFTKSDVDRLQYTTARAIQYIEIGDQVKGEQELHTSICSYKSSGGFRSTSAYAMDRLAESLELLGVLRGDAKLLDEAIDLYKRLLLLDQWTPRGKVKILRQLGDAHRQKESWNDAIDAYTRALVVEHSGILKVFRAECLLCLEGWESATTDISTIDVGSLAMATC